jgi:hypothetical protein
MGFVPIVNSLVEDHPYQLWILFIPIIDLCEEEPIKTHPLP